MQSRNDWNVKDQTQQTNICSKLTKNFEQVAISTKAECRKFLDVVVVNFKYVLHLVLVFLMLNLNMYFFAGFNRFKS